MPNLVSFKQMIQLREALLTFIVVGSSASPAAWAATASDPDRATALPAVEANALDEGADENAPDDPEVKRQVDADSAELEEMRVLEESTMRPPEPSPQAASDAQSDREILRTIERLGLTHPLRQTLREALEMQSELEGGEALTRFGELPRVTNLEALDMGQLRGRFDIPVEMQPLVAQYIRFFQGPGRKWFTKWMGRSTRFLPAMTPILEEHQLPLDTVYLAMIESGFAPHAYSRAKAAGPWQFMPATGRQYGLHEDFWLDQRRDPLKATAAAAKYLAALRREFGDWYLAWASYNAGSSKVHRVMKKKGSTNFWELASGKGLAKETQHYVPKLIACAIVAKNYKAFGFTEQEFEFLPPLKFDEVKLTDATDLEVIAKSAGVTLDELTELNPELKRWCTPPASVSAPYTLRLPPGTADRFTESFKKVPARERLSFRLHRVKRGDTLSQIARSFHSAPEAIMRLNGLKSVRSLRLGSELMIPVPSGKGGSVSGGAALDSAIARQVSQARKSGVAAVRPQDEIPAGARPARAASAGVVKTELVGGKTRVSYGVAEGDSLWSIGQRFGCTVEAIRGWNGLGKKGSLRVGSTLTLWPVGSGKAAAPRPLAGATASAQTHELAAGETLWSVAQRYGVPVDDLKRWNGIADHRSVQAGRKLMLAAP